MEVTVPVKNVPDWIHDMEFCHIGEQGVPALCGEPDDGSPVHETYDGSAICPTCGCPTCPRCAQLDALQESLEES